MKKPILNVQDLSVDFLLPQKQIKPAVCEVNFSLHKGEILALVGESGCGKSAIAKSLMQLFPKNTVRLKGDVRFSGYDELNLLSCSEKTLRSIRGKEIGMIFQDPMTSLNPTLTVGKQIKEGIVRTHPEFSRTQVEQRVIELLTLVGIQDPKMRIHDYPHTLSGGMRQRIMIAIALSSEPKILIADEPTTALDVTVQAQILSLLTSIRDALDMSILLITHDLSVVAGICDRALVMYAGRIVECGSVEQLFEDPQHPYTKGLLQAIPKLYPTEESSLFFIDGAPPENILALSGCAFAPRCKEILPICTSLPPPLFSLSDKETNTQCARCWHKAPRIP